MARQLTRGIDHFGVTVQDCAQALKILRDVAEGGLCYIEGPIEEMSTGWMKRQLGTRARHTLYVYATRVLNLNLELFSFSNSLSSSLGTSPLVAGSFSVRIQRKDAQTIAEHLIKKEAYLVKRYPPNSYYIAHPSGLTLLLEESTEDTASGVVSVHHTQFNNFVRELRAHLGMREVVSSTILGTPSIELAGDTGPSLLVCRGRGHQKRPYNSDIGGHHIAFHADSVDYTRNILATKFGYYPLGQPETIVDGPIAGDRWNYILPPSGVQLELINMPDGSLPYEQNAEYLRNPVQLEKS